jgi:hypothetical protein
VKTRLLYPVAIIQGTEDWSTQLKVLRLIIVFHTSLDWLISEIPFHYAAIFSLAIKMSAENSIYKINIINSISHRVVMILTCLLWQRVSVVHSTTVRFYLYRILPCCPEHSVINVFLVTWYLTLLVKKIVPVGYMLAIINPDFIASDVWFTASVLKTALILLLLMKISTSHLPIKKGSDGSQHLDMHFISELCI